ncbi:MAG TPA: acetyl-CoA C-acyltransferase family protein [Terriglobales bacterium]|nr:acetyl-CoA C-acyltransferase family protein [Terriglobales bacterium]
MQSDHQVVVLSAVRTPIGRYGGSLKDTSMSELGAITVREAISRAGIAPSDVEHVVFGNVIHTEPKDMYLSRVAAIRAGIPVETPALTLNRLCGSGLQAIVSAAQFIWMGDAKVAVAGGAESMSRAPYWLTGLRWGQRMNDTTAMDIMVNALTDPFENVHMGVSVENIAKKWGITREQQDCLAVESHRRASNAVKSCFFQSQIVPIELKVKGGTTIFEKDEGPRADTTLENLAKLKPAFDKNGTVTAGNASTVNDGAASVVLMEKKTAQERGLKPIARLIDYAVVGVDPKFMGIGPVPAVQKVLQQTGMKIEDFDVFEVNEAFAVQALAVARELGLPPDKTNPNGSGISLGHPVGATGAIIAVKLIHELRRKGGRYGIATLCIGGGQGIAAIFENLN